VVVGICAAGLILAPIASTPALASSTVTPGSQPAAVNLRIDGATATRVLSQAEGAAQEADPDQPKPMEEQAVTGPRHPVVKVKKAVPPPPPNHFAFLKDWPFWVIVGGVVVAGVGGLVLLHNSNKESPCGVQFTSGCFGSR
jgi:hypothetical protein